MHSDKVWTVDVNENVEHGANTLELITGGADSTLRLWTDSTIEQENLEKTETLKRMQEEQ